LPIKNHSFFVDSYLNNGLEYIYIKPMHIVSGRREKESAIGTNFWDKHGDEALEFVNSRPISRLQG
jgi:hypothetical protein